MPPRRRRGPVLLMPVERRKIGRVPGARPPLLRGRPSGAPEGDEDQQPWAGWLVRRCTPGEAEELGPGEGLDSARQLCGVDILEQISRRAPGASPRVFVAVHVGSQDHHVRVGALLGEARQGLKTLPIGPFRLEQDHIGTELKGNGQSVPPTPGAPDHLNARSSMKPSLEGVSHVVVIVDDEESCRFHTRWSKAKPGLRQVYGMGISPLSVKCNAWAYDVCTELKRIERAP